MPVGLIRKDYLLNEAFELIGVRLYGDDWKGQELFAPRTISPTEASERRAPHETAIEEAQALGKKLMEERRRTGDGRTLITNWNVFPIHRMSRTFGTVNAMSVAAMPKSV